MLTLSVSPTSIHKDGGVAIDAMEELECVECLTPEGEGNVKIIAELSVISVQPATSNV